MHKRLDISSLGPSVIISPHDDDGIIGCGGIIHTLKQKPIIIIVTDGSLGYVYPEQANDIVNIRKQEAFLAYASLDVPEENIIFLEYPDMSLRNYQSWTSNNGQEGGYQRFFKIFRQYQPQTIFLPYKHDPHPDHQCAFDIGWNALLRASKKRMLNFGSPIVLEHVFMYQVWQHLPTTIDVFGYKLNEQAKRAKNKAIQFFQSQINTIGELEQAQTLNYAKELYAPVRFGKQI